MCEERTQEPSCNKPDNSGGHNSGVADREDVPQKTAKEVVLEFLGEHDYPHQPKDIYGGLIYSRDITFSYRSVQVAVSDLHENGYLKKVEIDTDEGVVRDLPSNSSKRARYVVSESGRRELSE
ncbi:hypothetical protein [Halosegnis longus]|uniref:hypothetical protein n=1 Tax=Halosegnis longus TaxID=2216012 RepID=UPI00117C7A3F|nr:hypothetical protein [Salella cibi]